LRTAYSSTCAIIYYLAANPEKQAKLQTELDEQLGTEDELVANGEQVKRLPYLDACINEALRLHSTSALGLPRIVPEGEFRPPYFFFTFLLSFTPVFPSRYLLRSAPGLPHSFISPSRSTASRQLT
jgi:hypothetical protein